MRGSVLSIIQPPRFFRVNSDSHGPLFISLHQQANFKFCTLLATTDYPALQLRRIAPAPVSNNTYENECGQQNRLTWRAGFEPAAPGGAIP